jgi:hypothetical protein
MRTVSEVVRLIAELALALKVIRFVHFRFVGISFILTAEED